MKYAWLFVFVFLAQNTLAANETPQIARQAAQTSNATSSTNDVLTKFPVDVQSLGTDQSGTLLSYKLKEEIVGSKLFELTAADKKKFVLHLLTKSEFSDRPNIASQYSLVLVYQEDAGSLTYYLGHFQGLVSPESSTAEMQKILEWAYATLKRYNYLRED